MKISICHRHECHQAKGLCVVIDVLRAFTTTAFAFNAGVEEIVMVSTPEEAFEKYKEDPTLSLIGEVEGIKIDGFHFANSPVEIQMAEALSPKMVMRTTSGTQGVVGCAHADGILIASFVVAEATLQHLLEKKPEHVTFIVTGRNNGDEDLALAEYLQKRLEGKNVPLTPYLKRVAASPGGVKYRDPENPDYLLADLDLALQANRFSFAMEVTKEGKDLVARARKITR